MHRSMFAYKCDRRRRTTAEAAPLSRLPFIADDASPTNLRCRSSELLVKEHDMKKNSVYPYATGIAIAGAGVALAFGGGTAQAAPALAPLSPVSTECAAIFGCSPSG